MPGVLACPFRAAVSSRRESGASPFPWIARAEYLVVPDPEPDMTESSFIDQSKLRFSEGDVVFRKGEIVRKVPETILVDELFKEIDAILREEN